MKITRRHSLVLALVLVESVCFGGGGVWCYRWLSSRIYAVSRDQVLQDNALIAGQLAMLIEAMELKTLTPESPDWNKLQMAVEEIRLPNDGFVCVTDSESGKLLCHPALRTQPEMAVLTPGQAPLATEGGTAPIVQLLGNRGLAKGMARMPDGLHLIAAKRIPALGANVMVHQRHAGIMQSVERVMSPVRLIGATVAVTILGITILASMVILRRYDSYLERQNEQLEEMVRARTRSLVKTRNATIFGLAKLAESRDSDTGDHLDRIRDYSVLLAEALVGTYPAIDDQFIEDLALASSLHDIGKVGIPDSILLKPGRLSDDERRVMELHAQIGGKCLAEIEQLLGDDDFLEMAREIAFFHHERWDGSGYPFGLKAEQIPLAARIVAVADVYDALTSKRPYKEPWTHKEAYAFIIKGSETQFDPDVVAAFVAVEREFARRSTEQQPAVVAEEHRELLLEA